MRFFGAHVQKALFLSIGSLAGFLAAAWVPGVAPCAPWRALAAPGGCLGASAGRWRPLAAAWVPLAAPGVPWRPLATSGGPQFEAAFFIVLASVQIMAIFSKSLYSKVLQN